jgi:hypothetical protein
VCDILGIGFRRNTTPKYAAEHFSRKIKHANSLSPKPYSGGVSE